MKDKDLQELKGKGRVKEGFMEKGRVVAEEPEPNTVGRDISSGEVTETCPWS